MAMAGMPRSTVGMEPDVPRNVIRNMIGIGGTGYLKIIRKNENPQNPEKQTRFSKPGKK
jgi:hypothetical protein